MFATENTHICFVGQQTSGSFLPPLSPQASIFQKCLRFIKKTTLVAEKNPLTSKLYLSHLEIEKDRKKQVEDNIWVIHPSSCFRLYYEMWMTFFYAYLLFRMPLIAAFRSVLEHSWFIDLLQHIFSVIDICLNFRTGFAVTYHHVEMNPKRIAWHYLTGYFFWDLISSNPPYYPHDTPFRATVEYLGLLKIIRLCTCMKYLEASFQYFRIQTLYIKIIGMSVLITHYIVCCFFFLMVAYYSSTYPFAATMEKSVKIQATGSVFKTYVTVLNRCAGDLLGIEFIESNHYPWVNYILIIFTYLFGKFFEACITAIYMQRYTVKNCIEYRYQSMMSQVEAFMKAQKFSDKIQNKVKQFYLYKYYGKYFNENRIYKNISERLCKEIKYQSCRSLIRNVKFFQFVSQPALEEIVKYLKKDIYLPKDILIKAGVAGDCMFFLSSGTVAVHTPSGKEICHLSDGDYFGEISMLFPAYKRTATVTAVEFCEVYKLERNAFKKCFEKNDVLLKQIMKEAKRRHESTQQIEAYAKKIYI